MTSAEKLIGQMTNKVFKGVASAPRGPAYLALCRSFPLVEISSKTHHEAALKVIERLAEFMESATVPFAEDIRAYLRVLVDLVEKYEKEKFPVEHVPGREVLAYLLESQGLKQTDLAEELGGQSVVSSILRGDRQLNVRQIKALSKRFKVSPAVFMESE